MQLLRWQPQLDFDGGCLNSCPYYSMESWFFLWIGLLHILVAIGISDGPENVAVNIGESSRFTCRTEPNSKLRWSMRLVGETIERWLTRDEQILPDFAEDYSTNRSSGQLTLTVKNTSSRNAGRYICHELSSSKTASAELIVIESAPVCNSTQYESSSVLRCDLKYRGNWNPDIDLSIQDDNKANVCLSSEQITSHLVIPHSRHRDELRIYYMCTARFSKNGTTPKTFQGETHNYVVGTVARNIPEYSRSTKCNSEYFINCGIQVHLAIGLPVMASVHLVILL